MSPPVWLAAAALALNLNQARELAATHAAAVEQAQLEVESARGGLRGASVDVLPSVSGFAQVSTGSGLTSLGFERPVSTQIGVGVSGGWRVLSPSAWAASSVARQTLSGAEALSDWSRVGARRDVTVAYAQSLAADGVAAALAEAEADALRSLEVVEAVVAAGLQPRADVDQARADALGFAARAAEAAAQRVSACVQLQDLITAEIDGRCELEAVSWQAPADAPEAEHPALRASRAAVGAASAQERSARAAHLPNAGVSATAAEYILPGVSSGLGWQAGFDVQVPLTMLTGGAGDVKAARADKSRAESQLAAQQRWLQMSALSAEAAYTAATRARDAREGALAAAQTAFEQVDGRYQAGLVGVADWLAARRALIEARIALVQAEANVGAALAEVEAARGVGQ